MKNSRSAKAGKWVVRAEGKTRRGGEAWTIVRDAGTVTRVVTAPSSAAALDRIVIKHSKALRRLADK